MNYEQFKQISTFLHDQHVKQQSWLSKVPIDIKPCFYGNDYVDSLEVVNDRLMKELLPSGLYEEYCYFIFECLDRKEPWVDNITTADGVKWTVNNLEQFHEFVLVTYFGGEINV